MESAGKTMANRYWALERTLEEYQGRQKEIERIIKDNNGKPSGVAAALKKLFGISGHTLTMPDPGKKNGYRFVGFIKFETRGVVVERYLEDTPSGDRAEVQFTWADVAKAMIDHVKSKKEEPQADGTALERQETDAAADAGEDGYTATANLGARAATAEDLAEVSRQIAEKHGTELAKAKGEELIGSVDAQQARMMYEARIQLYKEQIGTGYIGIGRTLNEAKASGAIPHGEWAEWVTRTTGLEIRQAQRCMQAATEIKDGSALARLEMSKALLLLSSGLDEEAREQVAEKAAEEGATVKGLKEEIRKLKLEKVQSAGAVAEIRGELKKAQAERDQVRAQMQGSMQALDAQRAEISRQAYERGKGEGGLEANRENVLLQDRLKKLEEQLREAEIRNRDAEERIREKARQLDEAERKVKAADGLAERAAKRAEEAARKTAEEEARKVFQGKINFINGERARLQEINREQAAELEKSQKAASQRWDEGYKAGIDRAEQAEKDAAELREKLAQIESDAAADRVKAMDEMRESLDGERKEWLAQMEEMRADLAAAEAREEKRAKELAELKRERAQAGMDAARGIRAEGTGALDLAAAVRAFIGAAGVLPQMGQTLAGMSTEERGAILAQVDTVARWVEGCRAALGVVAADGSVM